MYVTFSTRSLCCSRFGSLFAAPEQARCPEGRKLASVEAFKLEEMDKFFFGAGGYTCDRSRKNIALIGNTSQQRQHRPA